MQRLEVSGAVRSIYRSLGVKRLIVRNIWAAFAISLEKKSFSGGQTNLIRPHAALDSPV